jgi:T5SS/PEP-CTERM-associated repeat protein/autotransporter-associated beta strand protein
LVVNGPDSLFEGPTFLQVGAGAYGKAVATDGGTLRAGAVNSVCSIGVFAPGEVTATWGGTLEYGWQVFVGDQNVGTLDVTDGGHYSAHSTVVGTGTGSDGTLTIRGPGSTMTHLSFLAVGWQGLGRAYFEDRCTVDLGGSLIVGGTSGGPGGSVYISDGAAVTSAAQARIGDYCPGELYITGGGTLTSYKGASATGSSGIIGRDAATLGYVSVSDDLSCWTQDGALTVGWLGQGYMEVLTGARVSCVDGLVGRSAGSDGYVLVSDTGSLWTIIGSAAVGGSLTDPGGYGDLEIDADGGVEVGGTLGLWPAGTLVVDGGTVTAGGLAGPAGAVVDLRDPAGGTALTVGSPGTAAFFGDLRDGPGGSGSLRKVGAGTQTLGGAGIAYTGATTVLEGTLRLSDTTAFASDIINGATTEFEVTAGTWTFDEAIAGAGTFVKSGDGTLVITGLQDYDPGAVFDVLGGALVLNTDAGSEGADLSISVTDAELYFGCNQHLDTLTISDGGKVIFAGAQVVALKHLVMDGTDLGAMTLTPEPATLSLLALGGLGVLLGRRRK